MNAALSSVRPGQRTLLWGLVLALAIYGYSSVLVGVLGPLHRHAEPAAARAAASVAANEGGSLLSRLVMAVQTWHENTEARRPALFVHSQSQAHHHGLFERHHHDADDDSVAPLGAQASGSQGADDMSTPITSGGASLPMGPLSALALPSISARHVRWPSNVTATWRSADVRQPERPPQA